MEEVFGGLPFRFYAGWMFFALLGFAIHKYLSFKNRGNRSKFKLEFFLKDNMVDLVAGAFISFIAGRFNHALLDLVNMDDPTRGDKMMLAFIFGFFYTSLLQLLRKTKIGDFIKSDSYPDGTAK